MKPIIKWPGGKSREISYVQSIMPPTFSRYLEPFLGGGAVFFALEPFSAVVNDWCQELMVFYRFVKGELPRREFAIHLWSLVEAWEGLTPLFEQVQQPLARIYAGWQPDHEVPADCIRGELEKLEGFLDPFGLSPDPSRLFERMARGLADKMARTKKMQRKHSLSTAQLLLNWETGLRGGFYYHLRDLMNAARTQSLDIPLAWQTANYYFIREFCYGSMFRFNHQGHFNVPYGGSHYNRKNFRAKVKRLLDREVEELLQGTILESLDFEEFLHRYPPRRDDFVFLDPPYDSQFSEYEQNPFTLSDQERLARCLYRMEAPFAMIIKDTALIRSLYQGRAGITLHSFDKTYSYNVKGRNQREVQHLLIYNYSPF